ncbi:hypothetical protein [Xanthomonas albilineans]|uniref:hypothetical protein n=1 Tax=Xanthomonas albilineans TaxID=29447 RepID=UPI0005F34254|nr:hypothetical protein [Xanthomonas albilineans]
MSAYLEFFNTLDRLQRLDAPVMAKTLGRSSADFLHRRWITESGYLTHVMVPFLDSQQEVQVQADPDAAVYRYRSPQQRGRTITRPLTEIALYTLRLDVWLDDMAWLIGIEERQRSTHRVSVPDHLWHLGDARIMGTDDFAPVFVARAFQRAPKIEMATALADAIWPRSGVLLAPPPSLTAVLPRDHAMRSLDEFVRVDEGRDVFDTSAFDRVLRGHLACAGVTEPEQFLQGQRLKLPHFVTSRELSRERAKIIKHMWGTNGQAAPEMSWAQVNRIANTGYQSFDDAFGGKAMREDVLWLVKRGKYRLRRKP